MTVPPFFSAMHKSPRAQRLRVVFLKRPMCSAKGYSYTKSPEAPRNQSAGRSLIMPQPKEKNKVWMQLRPAIDAMQCSESPSTLISSLFTNVSAFPRPVRKLYFATASKPAPERNAESSPRIRVRRLERKNLSPSLTKAIPHFPARWRSGEDSKGVGRPSRPTSSYSMETASGPHIASLRPPLPVRCRRNPPCRNPGLTPRGKKAAIGQSGTRNARRCVMAAQERGYSECGEEHRMMYFSSVMQPVIVNGAAFGACAAAVRAERAGRRDGSFRDSVFKTSGEPG